MSNTISFSNMPTSVLDYGALNPQPLPPFPQLFPPNPCSGLNPQELNTFVALQSLRSLFI